jgi:LmeA-like phospholipid-binding
MRRLLIALALLAVIFFFGDTALRSVAEHRAAHELRDGLTLSSTPSVGIGGWPFTVHLAAQSFPTVHVSGRDVRIEGLAVTRFDLELRDVDFSISKLLSGGRKSVDIQSGDGTISLSSELVSERLGAENIPLEFSIDGDEATVSSPELGASVSVDVTVSGHTLTIDPPGLDPVSIDLPRVADQVEYRSVSVSGDAIRAKFHLTAGRIALSE